MRLGDLDHLLLKLDAELSEDARYIDIADQIRDIINNAPTVTPNMAQVLAYESGKASVERPQGEWIEHENHIECDQCRVWFLKDHLIRKSYCPNCGARMVKQKR